MPQMFSPTPHSDFVDFREACEVAAELRGDGRLHSRIDAQFRRDIAKSVAIDPRLLRARFARLPETLRALYEYSIVDCSEAVQAMTLSSTGRREESTTLPPPRALLHAAVAVAEMVRREFATRHEYEPPQLQIVGRESNAETATQPPTSIAAPERTHASTAALPPLSSSTSASANRSTSGALVGSTPPDSGTASSTTPRPPIAPPRVFGTDSSLSTLSFSSPKTVADAANAAAALSASEAARRAEEVAQGVFSPRSFAAGSFRAPGTPTTARLPPPPSAAATSSSAARSLAAPTDHSTSLESSRRTSKRRPASPLQICEAKRSATTGSSAEDPVLVESPDKAAAEPQKRFSAFEFDEERTSRSTSPTLVIAEDEPIADASASQAAESCAFRLRARDSPTNPSPRARVPHRRRRLQRVRHLTEAAPRSTRAVRTLLHERRCLTRSIRLTMKPRTCPTLRRISNNEVTRHRRQHRPRRSLHVRASMPTRVHVTPQPGFLRNLS